MDWKICRECLPACSPFPRRTAKTKNCWNGPAMMEQGTSFSIPFHFYLTFSYKFLILFLLSSLTKMGRGTSSVGSSTSTSSRSYEYSTPWIYTYAPGLQDFKRVGRKSTIQHRRSRRHVCLSWKKKNKYQIKKSNPKLFWIINNVTQFLFFRTNRWAPLERAGFLFYY